MTPRRGPRCVLRDAPPGAAPQDGHRLAIGPAAQHVLQQIEIGPGWQRIEEALPHRRDTFGHAGSLKDLNGPSHGRRAIDQRAPHRGPGAKDFRQQRSRSPADVDHCAHRFPAAGDQHLWVGNAVPTGTWSGKIASWQDNTPSGAERSQFRRLAFRDAELALNGLSERTRTALDRAIESDEDPGNDLRPSCDGLHDVSH